MHESLRKPLEHASEGLLCFAEPVKCVG